MKIVNKTDIGLRRTMNQDVCAGETVSEHLAWLVVCDGMGGANAGNIASALALEVITKEITENDFEKLSEEEIKALLMHAVSLANEAIYKAAHETPELYGMGTTVVVCLIRDQIAHIVHVGDSRAYMIDGKKAVQLTVDHSMVQELLSKGDLTAEEAKNHPQKNIITRALGVKETVEPEYTRAEIPKKGVLIACTDGLSGYLEADEMFAYTKKYSGEALADAMVECAISRGGNDNITVVIADNRQEG